MSFKCSPLKFMLSTLDTVNQHCLKCDFISVFFERQISVRPQYEDTTSYDQHLGCSCTRDEENGQKTLSEYELVLSFHTRENLLQSWLSLSRNVWGVGERHALDFAWRTKGQNCTRENRVNSELNFCLVCYMCLPGIKSSWQNLNVKIHD